MAMASSSRTAHSALIAIRAIVPKHSSTPLLARSYIHTAHSVFRNANASSTVLGRAKCSIAPLQSRRWASTTSDPSTSTDPSLGQALDLLDVGSRALEDGDLDGALLRYKESLDIKETSGGWFNLGVCEYHLNNHAEAIAAWEKSIALTPSADAYTNLASAYIMSKPPQPALAIKHLTSAMELSPEDPEIAFNLAAILESTDNLEPALKLYEKALKGGIDRAAQNVRSVGAKLLSKKAAAADAQA